MPIRSKVPSQEYKNNWDKIFRKKSTDPVLLEAKEPFVGCGECDVIFPCYNNKKGCIREYGPGTTDPATTTGS